MNIAEWLSAASGRWPRLPALLMGTRVVADYATFAARASAIGAHLATRYGIGAGDRVALFMSNRTEYLECLYGIWWIAAAAVPINCKLHPREAAWIIRNAGAKLVFCCTESRESLQPLDELAGLPLLDVEDAHYDILRNTEGTRWPEPCEDDDLAWLFYTSGTTGLPKGAMLSHGNLIAMSLCYPLDIDPPEQADASLYAAPLSHGAGLYNFIHTRVGARHVVPESGGFNPEEILALASQLRNLTLFAAPTMVRRLVETAKKKGSSGDGIKTIVYGGAPMYLADIQEAIAVLGQRFVQVYGQGESPMTIAALSRSMHSPCEHQTRFLSTVGHAHSIVSIRVTGADGKVLAKGETGEVEVKGAVVMLGYWSNPKATAESIKEGWLRTGDAGHLDEDGLLTLSDRTKDVIISGGSNIYPREVEDVLLQHPAVREVAVIGIPDAEWGEIVVACVCAREGASLNDAELDEHCRRNIARFKRPKRYVHLQHLPKNNYGKVVKRELRALFDPPAR